MGICVELKMSIYVRDKTGLRGGWPFSLAEGALSEILHNALAYATGWLRAKIGYMHLRRLAGSRRIGTCNY